MKRVMAINDICCFGRCSLTYALPIISAAGVECGVLPTAILSVHTGYPGYTFCDMTGQFAPIIESLKNLNASFDGIFTGFLASAGQIGLVSEFIDCFGKNALIVADPAMADDGIMYSPDFNGEFVAAMRGLCKKAHVILPNLTEACFLLGAEYKEGPCERGYTDGILKGLRALGAGSAALTGIYFEEDKIGCGIIDETGEIEYIFTNKSAENISGTGDIFSSVVTAALMLGFSLNKACRIAAEYVCYAMAFSVKSNTSGAIGINFEQTLPDLLRRLGII